MLLLTLGLAAGLPAFARPDRIPPGQQKRDRAPDLVTPTHSDSQSGFTLTPRQIDLLLQVLRDDPFDGNIIEPDLRRAALSQATLPPGIRKQLARGKPLPPGLANKFVVMPNRLNTYLGLPSDRDVQVAVVGRQVVLLDPLSSLVLEVLIDVLS